MKGGVYNVEYLKQQHDPITGEKILKSEKEIEEKIGEIENLLEAKNKNK